MITCYRVCAGDFSFAVTIHRPQDAIATQMGRPVIPPERRLQAAETSDRALSHDLKQSLSRSHFVRPVCAPPAFLKPTFLNNRQFWLSAQARFARRSRGRVYQRSNRGEDRPPHPLG